MESERVCFRILRAESEREVEAIIESQHELSDASNWHPVDGRDDAYSRMEQNETKTNLEEYIDEIRRLAAQRAATVVMSIVKTLPSIINPASVADPDDD